MSLLRDEVRRKETRSELWKEVDVKVRGTGTRESAVRAERRRKHQLKYLYRLWWGVRSQAPPAKALSTKQPSRGTQPAPHQLTQKGPRRPTLRFTCSNLAGLCRINRAAQASGSQNGVTIGPTSSTPTKYP